jgi:hypothetical protein
MMEAFKYIRLDVDNVGDKIELALLNNLVAEAAAIHEKVQSGMKEIRLELSKQSGYEILMSGCDDILLRLPLHLFKIEYFADLKDDFYVRVGFSISIGVGESVQEAILNLQRAKLDGKNKIVG